MNEVQSGLLDDDIRDLQKESEVHVITPNSVVWMLEDCLREAPECTNFHEIKKYWDIIPNSSTDTE